ncbi:MAG: inositol-phosphate phosphatase [Gammaproteobacteria bacterium]|nr:inositol-phosphate phosphatase [Gammaproteobacteria bacterium]
MAKALEAAAAAAEIQRGYFRANLEVEIKADKTPVTVADVESEGAIREVLTSAFPDDGFYGEETGSSAMDADYVWLVDPLDGTKSFVRGYPFFSVQIALLHAGEIVLGVSNAPLFDEIAHAEKGAGAFINGAAAHISDVGSVADASLSLGNTHSIARTPAWQRLGELVAESSRIRGYGDFYHYHLLAAGRIDAVIESDVNILDIAALSLLVTEAGGIFTDLQGQSVTLGTTSVLAANRQLHGVIFERLNGSA